jgi:hypothetical protein
MNVYVSIVTIFIFSVNIMSQEYQSSSITTPIGCGTNRLRNVTHIKVYHQVYLNEPVRLQSCNGAQYNLITYWFTLKDFCTNITINSSFADVPPSGVSPCTNRTLNVSPNSCHTNYKFDNDSMTIINMTNVTSKEYICLYGASPYSLNTSAISHSIDILCKYKLSNL